MGQERCLTPDQVSDLLEDRLPADEAEACASHFNRCAQCQSLAEVLSDSEELRDYRQDYSQALAPTPDWLADVKETLYTLDATPTRGTSGEGAFRHGSPDLDHARTNGRQEHPRESAPTRAARSEDREYASQREYLRLLNQSRDDTALLPVAEPVTIGRFTIERLLGFGGFGVVYLANDPLLGRQVALKIPQPQISADPSLKQRFLLEARSAAGLDHPNIVPVYEAGDTGVMGYIASAFCPGQNLAEWMQQQTGPVEQDLAAALVAQLADALQYSHERGILHRDLKPANIMLVPLPGAPPGSLPFVPRLTDFGLAKLLETSLQQTRSSMVLGTPGYLAPEQAQGSTADSGPALDIYGLGVILYELLTRRLPFEADSVPVLLERIRNEAPPPPRRLRSDLSRDLETICLKCLHKEPGHRYATAGELAADLRRFVNGEAIQARPLTVLQRLGRWSRRPARIRDAAIVAIIVHIVLPLWTVLYFLLIFFDDAALPLRFELAGATIESLLAIVFLNAPMIWIGCQTLKRRSWALWAGTTISVGLVCLLTSNVAGWVDTPFSRSEHVPVMRTFVFPMLLVLFVSQLATYLFAMLAWRSSR